MANTTPTAYHYGYARVSTTAQDLTRQLDWLTAQGVPTDRVYADKRTGTDFEREGLAAVLAALRPGDVLHVASLDRLGRSLLKMVGLFNELHSKGIHVVAGGALPIDTRNGSAELAVLLLAFISEVELIFQRERRASARASKEARGVSWGRPRVSDYEEVRESFAEGLTVRQVMERHGISRATAFRIKSQNSDGTNSETPIETPSETHAMPISETPSETPDNVTTLRVRRKAPVAPVEVIEPESSDIETHTVKVPAAVRQYVIDAHGEIDVSKAGRGYVAVGTMDVLLAVHGDLYEIVKPGSTHTRAMKEGAKTFRDQVDALVK